MKRGYFFLLAICAGIAVFSGCAKESRLSEQKDVRQQKNDVEQRTVKPTSGVDVVDVGEQEEKEGVTDYLKSLVGKKHIKFLKTVAENTVLVIAGGETWAEARFVDIEKRQLLSVTKHISQGIGYRCQSYRDHIVLYTEELRGSGFYYIFDDQYRLTHTMDIGKKTGSRAGTFDSTVCVLPGKKKIVSEKTVGGKKNCYQLKLSDYSLKKGKTVYQAAEDQTGCVIAMSEMAAGVGEDVIFFLGDYYKENGEQSRNCYGCLDLNTGKMSIQHDPQTEQWYSKGMLVAGESAYFYDGMVIEDNYTGKVYCVDPSGKTDIWKLKNMREGDNLILSDGGKYLVTYYIDNVKEDSDKTRIHIYDKETKKEVAQKVLDKFVYDLNVFDDGRILATYCGDSDMEVMESEWK